MTEEGISEELKIVRKNTMDATVPMYGSAEKVANNNSFINI